MKNPQVIELLGLPRTGKTSIAKLLSEWLITRGFTVGIIHERVPAEYGLSKLDPEFNYVGTQLITDRYYQMIKEEYDYIIIDRGILNAMVWIDTLNRINSKTESTFNMLEKLANNALLRITTHAFFFSGDVQVALLREGALDRKKQGSIMNESVLQGYQKTYRDIESQLRVMVPTLEEVNTTNLSIDETLHEILKKISINS